MHQSEVTNSLHLQFYLNSTFTVPPIGGGFGSQSNICGEAFFAEIVNMLRPLATLAEELYRVSLTRGLTGF